MASSSRTSYLYLSDRIERRFAVFGDSLPSQALRRAIAAQIGRPRVWNWRGNLELDNVRATVEQVRAALANARSGQSVQVH
jgi:hypothetical protein